MTNEIILLINCSVSAAGFMLALLGLVINIFFHPMKPEVRKRCVLLFGIVCLYMQSDFFSYLGELMANRAMMISGLFFSSLFAGAIMPVVTSLILYFSKEKESRSPLMWISLSLLTLYCAMLISTLFSPVFYSVDLAGNYQRGPLYPLLLIPPLLALLLNCLGLLRRRGKMSRRQGIAMAGLLLPPLLCGLIQTFYEGILPIAVGIILGTLMMFMQIIQDQLDEYLEQKERNAQQEFEIRVLQMRPHFIYNALTSIYYLIDSDSEKAKKVVRDFTVYLRNVFSSVVRTEMIPFEEEMQHTRAYLAVEEARFGNQLIIVFDLPHIHFLIPPLTMQPLVENAVKHGMDPESGPLTVTIRTRKSNEEMQIIVNDDGAGYHPTDSTDDYSALDNIRARMKKFCQGTMSIRCGENGRGTCVILHIPAAGLNGTAPEASS